MGGTENRMEPILFAERSEGEVPSQTHISIGEELRCKCCGGAMLLAAALSSHRLNLFRCLACDFYDLVKA
jgi:hypothetical protein